MSEIIIENVTQFVEAIRHIAINDQTELFFRGHADRDYVAEPAIFRNKEHLKNEKHLFNDMITQCPEEFKDCQYTFEYLVKMQHYGLPTRLLDITSNALVALYFACCSSDDFVCDEQGNVIYVTDEKNNIKYDEKNKKIAQRKDGQVLVYQVQKDAIKNYNSDTVSVLSNLAQLDSDFELFIARHYQYIGKNSKLFDDLQKAVDELEIIRKAKLDDPNDTYVSLNQFDVVIRQQTKTAIEMETDKEIELLNLIKANDYLILMFLQNCKNDNLSESPLSRRYRRVKRQDIMITKSDKAWIEICIEFIKKIRFLNSEKERFLHFIKREKSYFIDKINLEDVQKIVCVQAKLNNPRIIRQNGLFFLFGMGYNRKGEPIRFSGYMNGMKEHFSPTIREMTTPTILISGQAKQTIIKELRALGISEETLMPEIDSVAKSIKNRYSH